jgi:hypothetical protein
MTLEEAEKYFGSLHAATVKLGIAFQNMTRWRKQGYIPLLQQYRIAELTDGELMPDELDPKIVNYNKRKRNEVKETGNN